MAGSAFEKGGARLFEMFKLTDFDLSFKKVPEKREGRAPNPSSSASVTTSVRNV